MDHVNLKVLIVDPDFYGLRALNSYLAWDRRTRVIALAQNSTRAFKIFRQLTAVELPNILLLEVSACASSDELRKVIAQCRAVVKDLIVLCLAHHVDPIWTAAAAEAGARGYLLRNELRLQLVGAILYAHEHRFVVTAGVRDSASPPYDNWLSYAEALPSERAYPEMSERIRQALWLCVIEGMPAQLAADEMGISANTVRSYIKEGYRILEAYDDTRYPHEMGPVERAFMRFTALSNSAAPPGKKRTGD
jgi:DNA-binding NarL/FixJ family response regulator